jgi:hypothetical protein
MTHGCNHHHRGISQPPEPLAADIAITIWPMLVCEADGAGTTCGPRNPEIAASMAARQQPVEGNHIS